MLFIDVDYQFSHRGPLTGLTLAKQWGVSLGGSYDITEDWSIGLRGEYFGLEPRAEFADSDIYYARRFVTDPTAGIGN